MFKRKLNSLFSPKWSRLGLSLIDGRALVSGASDTLDTTVPTAIDGLNSLKAMSDEDFKILLNDAKGSLSPQEKVLLFDILTLFNSLEMNLNRVIGFRQKSGSCEGLSTILKPNALDMYQALFETEDALNFRQILNENIEIRHLIAHGLPKKHAATDVVFFITSNQKEWNNRVKKREKTPELYTGRQDADVLLNFMSKGSIIYPVISLASLRGLKLTLIPIEKYFSEYAAIETT